jgi:hypothetical protein
MKITALKYLTYLCTILIAGTVIPAAEPVTIIRIINHTGGGINIELGKSKARIIDNDYYDVNIRSSEIPLLKVESTKASAGYWWTPIQVNITEQFNKTYGRSPVGANIIIEVTSSRLYGYLTNIRLSDTPIEREKISYKNMNSPWDAFPAVKQEYQVTGGQLAELLKSTDIQQKQDRIRLARLMLGLPKIYTQEDIGKHAREIALRYHPDKIPGEERNERTQLLSKTIMQLLGRAQEILMEP